MITTTILVALAASIWGAITVVFLSWAVDQAAKRNKQLALLAVLFTLAWAASPILAFAFIN